MVGREFHSRWPVRSARSAEGDGRAVSEEPATSPTQNDGETSPTPLGQATTQLLEAVRLATAPTRTINLDLPPGQRKRFLRRRLPPDNRLEHADSEDGPWSLIEVVEHPGGHSADAQPRES